MMIDWLIRKLFWYTPLRDAIFDEVHLYDEIESALAEYREVGPTNLTWSEGDIWYGWTYNPIKKRYYFDDIGYTSRFELWDSQWLKDADDWQLDDIR